INPQISVKSCSLTFHCPKNTEFLLKLKVRFANFFVKICNNLARKQHLCIFSSYFCFKKRLIFIDEAGQATLLSAISALAGSLNILLVD
ncbi:hypothetical protein, partial [Campylobacter sp.]|uniref:hypothetical protein n=1 Tax=Campylobacter sp. TaxID=205 RepID=UPI002A920A26